MYSKVKTFSNSRVHRFSTNTSFQKLGERKFSSLLDLIPTIQLPFTDNNECANLLLNKRLLYCRYSNFSTFLSRRCNKKENIKFLYLNWKAKNYLQFMFYYATKFMIEVDSRLITFRQSMFHWLQDRVHLLPLCFIFNLHNI